MIFNLKNYKTGVPLDVILRLALTNTMLTRRKYVLHRPTLGFLPLLFSRPRTNDWNFKPLMTNPGNRIQNAGQSTSAFSGNEIQLLFGPKFL